jgi:DoxX-like family
VFSIGSGGAAEAVHLKPNVDGIVHVLGYPLYFLTIIGIWKVLGVIVLLVLRFPRLKEWAYAGIFSNVRIPTKPPGYNGIMPPGIPG